MSGWDVVTAAGQENTAKEKQLHSTWKWEKTTKYTLKEQKVWKSRIADREIRMAC